MDRCIQRQIVNSKGGENLNVDALSIVNVVLMWQTMKFPHNRQTWRS